MNKKKLLTSGVAVVATVGVLFGGTFAWQSISQRALNEVSRTVNPGGRLHDDFVEITYDENNWKQYDYMTFNKDVYVENFTDLADNGVQVFARVRLDEYMELGEGAGVEDETGAKYQFNGGKVKPLVAGTTMEDKSTWTPHVFDVEDAFDEYWTLTFGGSTVYMPTFNKNKDSLEADKNGGYNGAREDFTIYDEGGRVLKYAIYDVDNAGVDPEGNKLPEVDELADVDLERVYANGESALVEAGMGDSWKKHVELKQETHTATKTLDSFIISMDYYLVCLDDGKMDGNDFDGTGDFWVYDADGWAYWANPIDPSVATGLLLDGIQRTDTIINEDWYYAINVVAQFVTGDDLGQADGTGFYDKTEGCVPSDDALVLLNTIGVDVTFEADTAEALEAALTAGGIVKLAADIQIDEQLTVTEDTILDLNGHTLRPVDGAAIFDGTTETWSVLSVQGEGVTLTINDSTGAGVVDTIENDSYAVDVRGGAKLVIYGGSFIGNKDAVYVKQGEAIIYGGQFDIHQKATDSTSGYTYLVNCCNENYANGTASITICGGKFKNIDPSWEGMGDDGSFVAPGYIAELESEGSPWYVVRKAALNDTTGTTAANTDTQDNTGVQDNTGDAVSPDTQNGGDTGAN